MTPPQVFTTDDDTCAGAAAPAAHVLCLETLSKRADFLRAARARRQSRSGLLLQARERGDGTPGLRVGYTCSKKIGNAVTRNRAKRRLRAAARALVPHLGRAGWDYVLIGRPGVTVDRPFAALCADLESALRAIHGPAPATRGAR